MNMNTLVGVLSKAKQKKWKQKKWKQKNEINEHNWFVYKMANFPDTLAVKLYLRLTSGIASFSSFLLLSWKCSKNISATFCLESIYVHISDTSCIICERVYACIRRTRVSCSVSRFSFGVFEQNATESNRIV